MPGLSKGKMPFTLPTGKYLCALAPKVVIQGGDEQWRVLHGTVCGMGPETAPAIDGFVAPTGVNPRIRTIVDVRPWSFSLCCLYYLTARIATGWPLRLMISRLPLPAGVENVYSPDTCCPEASWVRV